MPKLATTAIILHGEKILVAKRQKDDLWEFPGGKIDPGETPQECIIREIKEELDISTEILKEYECIKGTYRGIEMELYGFLVRWLGGDIKLNVHQDYQWIGFSELGDYDMVEEDLVLFEAYRSS